jgi:hypothetical protein
MGALDPRIVHRGRHHEWTKSILSPQVEWVYARLRDFAVRPAFEVFAVPRAAAEVHERVSLIFGQASLFSKSQAQPFRENRTDFSVRIDISTQLTKGINFGIPFFDKFSRCPSILRQVNTSAVLGHDSVKLF